MGSILRKNIIETVNYYSQKDAQRVEEIRTRLKRYFNDLELLGLHDIDLAKNQKTDLSSKVIYKHFLQLLLVFRSIYMA